MKQLKEQVGIVQVGIVLTEVVVAHGVMKRAGVGVGRPMQPACSNRLQAIDCFEEAVCSWLE